MTAGELSTKLDGVDRSRIGYVACSIVYVRYTGAHFVSIQILDAAHDIPLGCTLPTRCLRLDHLLDC